MDEIFTGWLLDLYAEGKDVSLWLLEDNGQRRRLIHTFPATFYAAGPSVQLRTLWVWLSGQDVPIRLSRAQRLDVFEGLITVLAVEVLRAPEMDTLFRQVTETFPDLVYYDADVALCLRYAAEFGVFPLARCRVGVDRKAGAVSSERRPDSARNAMIPSPSRLVMVTLRVQQVAHP